MEGVCFSSNCQGCFNESCINKIVMLTLKKKKKKKKGGAGQYPQDLRS
jgi:hypothetical protein